MHTELPHGTPRRRIESATRHAPWRSRDIPVPLRISLLAHADHCVAAVRCWSAHALPGALPPEPVRPGRLLQQLCLALSDDLPAAVRTAADAARARKVWRAYTHACQLLDREEPPRRLPQPCPVCDLKALMRRADGDIFCRSCNSYWPATG
ncbi:hypothetical protein ABZ611_29830 [Streptomyces sp. NPDC007861]|uniref:hypothetical protein n=1 Tax=Streptomyces sp. NPDC007861 TaxID=3154893 RepID=UPI0033DD4BCA